MIVEYEIKDHKIFIHFTPQKDCENGLVIQHGDLEPTDDEIGHQPAIVHDLYKGVQEYPLPPEFDTTTIKQVDVDENAVSPGGVIPKW